MVTFPELMDSTSYAIQITVSKNIKDEKNLKSRGIIKITSSLKFKKQLNKYFYKRS